MASPSKPLSIRQPRAHRGDETLSQAASFLGAATPGIGTPAVGTPDLRALRAGYTGTPPVANIPPRVTALIGGTTTPLYKPASSTSLAALTPQRSGQAVGGLSATRQFALATPAPISGLDDLPMEDKVQVLERHLVPPELRTKPGTSPLNGESAADDGGNASHSNAPSISSQPPEFGGDDDSRRSSIVPAHLQLPQREDSEAFPIPFHAPGADVT